MRTLPAALIAAFFVTFAWPVSAQAEPPAKQHEEMLYTVVQVQSGFSRGSGTVIWSGQRNGRWETYILTNHHVIDDSVKIEEEWDSDQGKEVKRESRDPVTALWFGYNDFSRSIGTSGREATIEAYDKKADLALLKLREKESGVPFVAGLIPEGETIYLFDPTFAVGSGMGRPPFATDGMVAYLDGRIDGHRYMMSTAPIIFGNSGGALFRYSGERDRYELIGVPSRGTVAGFSIVEHMAWSIVIETVRGFLRDNGYGFIVGDEEDAGE